MQYHWYFFLCIVLVFGVESTSIREVDHVKSSPKLTSSNVCEDKRYKLSIGIGYNQYSGYNNKIYLLNGKIVCVFAFDVIGEYKFYYNYTKLTTGVVELSIIEDKSVIKLYKNVVSCGDDISYSKNYTYSYIHIY